MSLTDLEKRAVLKPVEAELDRQKEKAAKFKKERDTARYVLQEVKDRLAGLAVEDVPPVAVRAILAALKSIGDEEAARERLPL